MAIRGRAGSRSRTTSSVAIPCVAMPKRIACVALLLATSLVVAQTAPSTTTTGPATTQAALPTPAEVIARYVSVTGGADAYASLKSRRASGTFNLPDLGIAGKLDT